MPIQVVNIEYITVSIKANWYVFNAYNQYISQYIPQYMPIQMKHIDMNCHVLRFQYMPILP